MDLSTFSDEELVFRLQKSASDTAHQSSEIQAVYQEFYKRYYKRAYHLSRYYGVSRTDSEDIVQEALISLFKSVKTFKEGNQFKSWFFKIILNLVRKRYNTLKRHQYSDLDDYKDAYLPEEKNILEQFQFQVHLKDITNRLPDKLREVLLLKIYSCLDLEEISAVTGISSRQVYNRLNQAYEILKVWLKEAV